MLYELDALIFHSFLLFIAVLLASDGGPLDDAEVLVHPAILGEFPVDVLPLISPDVSVEPPE